MSEPVLDLFTKVAERNKKEQKEFLFKAGQEVRVLKTLEINVDSVSHLLGQKGHVESRYRKMIYNEIWYNVRFPSGEIEPFAEKELDSRYIKKKVKQKQ